MFVECQREAWNELALEVKVEIEQVSAIIERVAAQSQNVEKLTEMIATLKAEVDPGRKDVVAAGRKTLRLTIKEKIAERQELINWLNIEAEKNSERFNSKLFTEFTAIAIECSGN